MFIYSIVRNSLNVATAHVQSGHACSEAASAWTLKHGCEISPTAHLGALTATKAQLRTIGDALTAAGVAYQAIVETDGPLKGVLTTIKIITKNKAALVALIPLLN